ncbi:MAG TPA: hypothetical protein DCO75_03330 [Fibrobacteres bacterium]|nr:hypothetical protein [Fibrobacterota bacterium]
MKKDVVSHPLGLCIGIIVGFVSITYANVGVTNFFTSCMVLQRNMIVPIWGTASSGEAVTVTFNGQTKTASASSNGKWSVKLDSMVAGGPYTMIIAGNNTITIKDVYVGEVWQCAGQSNMDTRVNFYSNYADIMDTTNIPLLRYYTLRQPGLTPVWDKCTTSVTTGRLSCLGFFFGREIQRTLGNVAVGLVVTAVGGTTVASWLDSATLAQNPGIKTNDTSADSMFTQWVSPVVGCAMRGTVWIQGENDRSSSLAPYYAARFKLLINAWRTLWGIGDFPFHYVQLANYGSTQTDANESSTAAVIREGQRLALSLPNTAMAVVIDIGDSAALHFTDKLDAGIRLSLPSKALIYGKADLVYSGPLFVSKSIEGSKIHCKFKFVGSGLKAKSSVCKGFAIAGSDGKFVWADAVIHNDTATVSSSSITSPTQVRYAYVANPIGNLYNIEGLPASPFQTEGDQIPVAISSSKLSTAVFPVISGNGKVAATDALGRKMNICRIAGSGIVWLNVNNKASGTVIINQNSLRQNRYNYLKP